MTNERKGYTLVEILVVISIVGLLFGVGFVSYREFSRRQALAGAARQFGGDLRLAQELALAGKKPAVCGANALDGYQFVVTPPNSYRVRAVCNLTTAIEKTVVVSSGVSISGLVPDLTPSNTILFKTLSGGTNIPAGTTVITLTQDVTADTRRITVTAGGEIR